jgi:hypothetical protein
MPGTLPLRLPPVDIDQRVLDIVPVSPKALIRVSRYNTGEPFFGRTGACRFDDAAKQFGTCYLGFDLPVAFAESVLHNKEPDSSGFAVPGSEIDACFALSFSGKDLKLAKLYGAALLRLCCGLAVTAKLAGRVITLCPRHGPAHWWRTLRTSTDLFICHGV